jgi:hypothetical protein
MAASFTKVTELDRELLLNLPYPDLIQACQVDQNTQEICKDPTFWKERLRSEYGFGEPVPENTNYEQQYRKMKEFRVDPEIFQKFPRYREAFVEVFEDPEIFYEERTDNPNYTLTHYALD